MPDAACGVRRPVHVPSAALLARLAPLTPVPGRPDLVAHHAPDLLALWQAWEAECGARHDVPFRAVVWPAAQLLARVFQAEPAWVRGKSVLDLGCGGGVAGIAAAKAGVRCRREACLATAWDVEGTRERTVRLLTLEA
jgi:predicted nicotinamide N-methyase